MILNILLNFPEELNLKVKPSAIRENKVFTLDARQISMESAGADDNGAYVSKGCPKKYYAYNEEMCRISHKGENGQWYVLFKESKHYVRQALDKEDIIEMQRYYRISKCNPSFSRTFVTIRRYLKKDVEPYYLVIYKWQGEESQNFVVPRHENATNPHYGSYYRKDKLLKNKVDSSIIIEVIRPVLNFFFYDKISQVQKSTKKHLKTSKWKKVTYLLIYKIHQHKIYQFKIYQHKIYQFKIHRHKFYQV